MMNWSRSLRTTSGSASVISIRSSASARRGDRTRAALQNANVFANVGMTIFPVLRSGMDSRADCPRLNSPLAGKTADCMGLIPHNRTGQEVGMELASIQGEERVGEQRDETPC